MDSCVFPDYAGRSIVNLLQSIAVACSHGGLSYRELGALSATRRAAVESTKNPIKEMALAIDEAKRAHTDRMIAETIRNRQSREQGYREQALKIYPWICGRCAREFQRENLNQLTVHHRDHNHENNPTDGSNWELLCLYCHDNEHARELDHDAAQKAGVAAGRPGVSRATAQPFANLKDLLRKG